jgi:hypothetical protein
MAVRLSALRAGRPLPPGRFMVLICVRGSVDPRAIVRLEELGKLKKFHLIGTRTRDLPVCSIVPQPTTLPRTPLWNKVRHEILWDYPTCLFLRFQMFVICFLLLYCESYTMLQNRISLRVNVISTVSYWWPLVLWSSLSGERTWVAKIKIIYISWS